MELKIEANRTITALLIVIALLLLVNLIKPYIVPASVYAEFNNDSFESDSRNLEKIANSLSSIASSMDNIEYELGQITDAID